MFLCGKMRTKEKRGDYKSRNWGKAEQFDAEFPKEEPNWVKYVEFRVQQRGENGMLLLNVGLLHTDLMKVNQS